MPAATSIEADLVTHNKSIGAPLHCNRLYGYGLRCGVSIADHPSLIPCSERTSPTPIFKDQRLRGRCACKHRNIRRETSCGCDADKAWQRCSFFSVVSGAGFSKRLCATSFAAIVQEQDA